MTEDYKRRQINCPSFGNPTQSMIDFIDIDPDIQSLVSKKRRAEWKGERTDGIKPLKGIEQRAHFWRVK